MDGHGAIDAVVDGLRVAGAVVVVISQAVNGISAVQQWHRRRSTAKATADATGSERSPADT
ncbi:hypothetical protein GCM10018962_23530 [Dactylosporangium matsuzakiense]|uniref:Uncharacterized protein n=2 Tax=Dactylosporangium matsuzakiense TaxID=53360 RepID=A0A9W6NNF2_9ACTN|nr:hypothetical protein GCM10017581_049950 [Dactylosporangium matsuzakiense]